MKIKTIYLQHLVVKKSCKNQFEFLKKKKKKKKKRIRLLTRILIPGKFQLKSPNFVKTKQKYTREGFAPPPSRLRLRGLTSKSIWLHIVNSSILSLAMNTRIILIMLTVKIKLKWHFLTQKFENHFEFFSRKLHTPCNISHFKMQNV